MEKTETLASSNDKLQSRVDSLKIYYDNEAQYLADMEPMKENIDAIFEKYTSHTQEEDVIMQAVFTQAKAPIVYSNINIGEVEANKVIDEGTVLGANVEKYQSEISFVKQSATYANTVDYEGLKIAIQSLFDSNYKIGIKNITYTSGGDEDGTLTGILDVVFYSVQGNGKEYELPNIIPYVSGTNNIFGATLEETEE